MLTQIDKLTAKREKINLRKTEAIRNYPRMWSELINEWKEDVNEDRLWLIYSANYLFRTGGIRWAIDPLTLQQRVPEAKAVDIFNDLSNLTCVLLTHSHADHLDFNVIRYLKDLPILWMIPEAVLPKVITNSGLSLGKVIVPKMLDRIHIGDITVTPFEGIHWEMSSTAGNEPRKGVPSVAYLVEFNGKHWLFPGDTRTYDTRLLPPFGPLEGVFAHVWLGRSSALLDPPPLLEPFCRFCVDLKPRRLIITHLEEFGRGATEYWDEWHFDKVRARCQGIAPDIQISAAKMGDSVLL